jgi:hypothetical protein
MLSTSPFLSGLPAPLFVVSLAARDPAAGLAQSNINKNIKEEIVSFVGYFTLYFRIDLRVFLARKLYRQSTQLPLQPIR